MGSSLFQIRNHWGTTREAATLWHRARFVSHEFKGVVENMAPCVTLPTKKGPNPIVGIVALHSQMVAQLQIRNHWGTTREAATLWHRARFVSHEFKGVVENMAPCVTLPTKKGPNPIVGIVALHSQMVAQREASMRQFPYK